MKTTNYQCPNCTAPLHFGEKSGKLECDYCESSFSVDEIEALLKEAHAKADAEQEKTQNEPQQDQNEPNQPEIELMSYTCPSCGAELICEKGTIATSCPYCANPTVVPGSVKGEFHPDGLIPFKFNKEDALTALKRFYEGKKFLPSDFVSQNHIDEIKGVYVPFWLYSATSDIAVDFHGKKVRTYSTASENVKETHHYDVFRSGSMRFESIPADASTKMPDDHMDAIEPYDFNELRAYSHAYLPGFLANSYDVQEKDNRDRIEQRILTTSIDVMRNDVHGYDSVEVKGHQLNIDYDKPRYVLLPVWLLSTRWKDQTFLFAMNGQTGRLVGNLPIDYGKFTLMLLGSFVLLSVILSIISLALFGEAS